MSSKALLKGVSTHQPKKPGSSLNESFQSVNSATWQPPKRSGSQEDLKIREDSNPFLHSRQLFRGTDHMLSYGELKRQ